MNEQRLAPPIELRIDSAVYTGWQRVTVTRSIDALAGSFDLTLTDKWALDDQGLQLATGQKAQIRIAGTPIITGHVEVVAPRISADEHSISVRGRDAAGDLVDCSAVDGHQEISGKNLLQVARSMCKPFGIGANADADVGAAFSTAHFQVGETVYEVLDKLGRLRGVLCMSDGLGGITMTRTGTKRATQTLGEHNILKGDANRDSRERFHMYRVLGQFRTGAYIVAETAAQATATVTDPAITRYRPHVVQAEDMATSAACRTRAQWERSVRAGRANTARVTVAGWLDDGTPWTPNTLIDARYRPLGLDDTFLISQVVYTVDADGGQLTQLTLAPPDAFKPEPETQANATGGAGVLGGAP